MELFSSDTSSRTATAPNAPMLVDTNIWIGVENQEISKAAVLAAIEPHELVTSPVVLGELKLGVELAQNALTRQARQIGLNIVMKHRLLEHNIEVALRYGILCAHVRQSGAVRQRSNDLWLAAAAHVHKASILTLNPRDFDDLPGLKVHALQRVSKTVSIKRS